MQPVRSEFMFKFLFSSLIPEEKVIEMLNSYKKQQDELNKYKGLEKDLEAGIAETSSERTRFWKATLGREILAFGCIN